MAPISPPVPSLEKRAGAAAATVTGRVRRKLAAVLNLYSNVGCLNAKRHYRGYLILGPA